MVKAVKVINEILAQVAWKRIKPETLAEAKEVIAEFEANQNNERLYAAAPELLAAAKDFGSM